MSTALVSIVDGIPTTTSQKVAETFGKRHDSVVRGIRDLQSKCPENFNAHNFVAVDYTDPKGEKRPMYLLTRDGLTLLVMGYTGKEAMKFKLAYIEAFNCMEKQLETMRAMPDPCLSVEDRRPLSVLIGQWAGKARMSFPDCWRELHTVFGIATVSELPANMLPAALAWVQAKIDALEARRAPELPAPESAPAFPLEIADYNGKNFWKDLEDVIKRIDTISNALTFNARTGCLMKHEFYADTINNQVGIAQGSLVLARAALGDALRLKGRRDVWK